jgi:putative Mg2+ transporter-C (MgtC) family protein
MTDVISSGRELEILWFAIPKILIATICGSIIGWDREKKNKVAGLRTNILICVGSTIFTITSVILAQVTHSDPTRILSTIVTGIGFLGGGVIMRTDDKIIGMTTAAFIWVVSAIGILCGLGSMITPVILTIGLLLISKIFERVERYIKSNNLNDPKKNLENEQKNAH